MTLFAPVRTHGVDSPTNKAAAARLQRCIAAGVQKRFQPMTLIQVNPESPHG